MKTIYTFLLLLLSSITLQAQCEIANGDMESFVDVTADFDQAGELAVGTILLPEGFAPGIRLLFLSFLDGVIPTTGQGYIDFWSEGLGVKPSDDAYSGDKAVQFKADTLVNLVDLSYVGACDMLPESFSLAMKHVGEGKDSLIIQVAVLSTEESSGEEDEEITDFAAAYAVSLLTVDESTDYRVLDFPFSYNEGKAFDTLVIQIATLQETSYLASGNDSYFLLDDLKLNFGTTSIDLLAEEQTTVYPNPVKDQLTIEAKESSSYQIIGMDGRIYQNGLLLNAKQHISLTDVPDGLYILRQEGESGNISTTKILKRQ